MHCPIVCIAGEYAIHVFDANGAELPGSPFMAHIVEREAPLAPAGDVPLADEEVLDSLAEALARDSPLDAQLPARHEVPAAEADRRSPAKLLELLVEWPTVQQEDECARRLPQPPYQNLHSLLAPKLRPKLAVTLYSSRSGLPLALEVANDEHNERLQRFKCRPRDIGPHVAFVSLGGHPLRNSPCHVSLTIRTAQ